MNSRLKIRDYGLIGNCRAAALVGNNGSIDWCCLPDFHSPSLFAYLLGEQGGFFSVAPSGAFHSSQRYVPDTNVLETIFQNETGAVRLTDAFTAMTEEEKTVSLVPDHEIMRVVEGISGSMSIRLFYAPRFYYGKYKANLRQHSKLGIQSCWKGHIVWLTGTLEPELFLINEKEGTAVAEFEVQANDRIIFSLSYSAQSPAVIPEVARTGWQRLQQTVSFWKNWIGNCRYSGLYQEEVKRSALALKLLAHAPSGAIIAAPTTSLPEEKGGIRNWDYRFCWLRDASFTARVLVKLGFTEEVHAYMNWILHATQLTRPKLQVVYSVYGHASLEEKELEWLQGYEQSRPVRIGNGADDQFQLDVYGEVMDAIYAYAPLVKAFDNSTRRFLTGMGDVICKRWQQPDHGIWEVRSGAVHHTHSKVMAWVGLDRLVRLAEKYQWKKVPLEKWKSTANAIHQRIERQGFQQELNSYTRELGGNTLDASLLILPLVGFCKPDSPRMAATIHAVQQHLVQNGLVYRYRQVEDGISGGEGSFVACSFWLAENLAKAGRFEEAKEVFEAVLQHAGPTGLLPEEIDPYTHELLGNYPQGFSHIGLINAALSLTEAQ
jgi:GH15 family glucan-1,4-alpha-glucosidase